MGCGGGAHERGWYQCLEEQVQYIKCISGEQWSLAEWISIRKRWMNLVNSKWMSEPFVLNPFCEIKSSTDYERMVLHGWRGRGRIMKQFQM